MFSEMRKRLNISKPTDILDHIHSLPTGGPQEAAYEHIKNVEREAMGQMQAQPGLVDIMDYLDKREIKKAICTRNFE